MIAGSMRTPARLAATLVAAAALVWPGLPGPAVLRAAATLAGQASTLESLVPQAGPAHDEFVGPFASWIDAKAAHGAIGDGRSDDTAALQSALDRIAGNDGPRVVFLPRGTYRITRTLQVRPALGIGILGEDPATTRIVWDGPAGGTMVDVLGVAYSRIGRLTFDGRSRAAVAVEQSWDNRQGNFDTGNEYADDWFVDVDYGIHGGFRGHGFAETSVMRGRFLRNARAGIALGNFNALDLWVWHSVFEDCGVGVTNEPGAGNYRVYESVFRRSSVADLMMQNTGGFTARHNYSIGSSAFWVSGAPLNHPATIDIQSNTILDTRSPVAIRLGNQGPGLLLDNQVRSLPNTAGPVVAWASMFGSDVIAIGNTFTVSGAVTANGRLLTLDDRIVTRERIDARAPVLPGVQPSRARRVFEVAPGATADVIQEALDAAGRSGAERPVVHLPFGVFTIDRTLRLPPDVQLVGDGMMTVLRWAGTGRGPMVALPVPARATMRELQLDGASRADGLIANALDAPGSRVHLEGVQLRSGKESNLLVDGVDRTRIDLVDFGHAYSPTGTSLRIVGGSGASQGGGRTVIYSGAAAQHRLSYEVTGGATLVARDIWYEGKADGGFARIHGAGRFTMQGARVATPGGWTPPAFTIDGLDGRVTLLTTLFDDRVLVAGASGRTEVLALANMRENQPGPPFANNPLAPARLVVLNQRQRVPASGLVPRGTVPVANIGALDAAFARRMLEDTRAVPRLRLEPAAADAADLRMFRVWVQGGLQNVVLRGRP